MSWADGKARRKAARDKYKPSPIHCLLIAEAPPSDDRYFYFEDVQTADWLFRGVMRTLFLSEFTGYARRPEQKRNLLCKFREDGFWLLDAIEDPLEGAPKGGPTRVRYVRKTSDLLHRLGELVQTHEISLRVPIILIKATVYDALYDAMKAAGYNVVDKKIPFPSSGQQFCFEVVFKEALGLI